MSYNPRIYKRYVDDIITKRSVGKVDYLYSKLNNYHPNLKFIAVANPKEFLDTSIISTDGIISTNVFTTRYRRNAITGELHRANKIASTFDKEVLRIKKKFLSAGFPIRFINTVVEDFTKSPDDEPLIPNWLFDDRLVKTLRLPFCHNNEISSEKFIDTLEQYTNHKFKFIVIWETMNIRSIFSLKDRVIHKSCVIYHGICTCGITYAGETDRLATTRWKEHDNPIKSSEPSKHLSSYPDHKFTWNIISSAPHSTIKRKILPTFGGPSEVFSTYFGRTIEIASVSRLSFFL